MEQRSGVRYTLKMLLRTIENRNLFNRHQSSKIVLQALSQDGFFPPSPDLVRFRAALAKIDNSIGIPSGTLGTSAGTEQALEQEKVLIQSGYKARPLRRFPGRTEKYFVKRDKAGILTDTRTFTMRRSLVFIRSFQTLNVKRLNALTKRYQKATRQAMEAERALHLRLKDNGRRARLLKRLINITGLEVAHLDFLPMLMSLDRTALPLRFAYDFRIDEFTGPGRVSLQQGYESIARFIAARDQMWALNILDSRGSQRGTRTLSAKEAAKAEQLDRKGVGITKIVSFRQARVNRSATT